MATAARPPGGYPVKVSSTFGAAAGIGTWQPIAATSGTDSACTSNTEYVASIYVPRPVTANGVQYLVGSVGGTDKVVATLRDANGVAVANSAVAGATVGTAAQTQQVAFTAAVDVAPGLYYIGLTFNGTTGKFRTVPAYTQTGTGLLAGTGTQTFGTVANITPVTTFTADKGPVASLY